MKLIYFLILLLLQGKEPISPKRDLLFLHELRQPPSLSKALISFYLKCDAPNPASGVKRGCHFFFPVYYKFINFKLVHSYNVKHLTCTIFYNNGLQNIFKIHKWECSTYTKTLHLFTNNKKNITYTK